MQRVSTNLTLFYKLFIPVFWITLAGAATLATLFLHPDFSTGVVMLIVYALSLIALYFTFFQFKRVEMSNDFVYVTDYFRHFQYPFHNIKKITHRNFLIFHTATIHFRVPGSFGKRVIFIPSHSLYQDFWEAHPQLKADLVK